MTLNWRGNWRAGIATLYSRGGTTTESTESDSDYGIEEIDEDGARLVLPPQDALDTLDSNLELDFPTIGTASLIGLRSFFRSLIN